MLELKATRDAGMSTIWPLVRERYQIREWLVPAERAPLVDEILCQLL
jgi:hypothetical protein